MSSGRYNQRGRATITYTLVADEAMMKHEKDMATMVVEALKVEMGHEKECMKEAEESARQRSQARSSRLELLKQVFVSSRGT